MTTERYIKKSLKPILDHDSDLAYYNRLLFVGPVRHHLNMIGFYCASEPTMIFLVVHLYPLSIPQRVMDIGEPFTNYVWPTDRMFFINDKEYPNNYHNNIRNTIYDLKKIQEIEVFRSVHNEYYKNDLGSYTEHNTFMACMLGEWDVAAEMLRREQVHPDFWTARMINEHVSGLGDRLREKGNALSKRDKRALIAMMHEREAIAAKALKLEKHWQPSPFPAEEAGLV